MGETLSEMQAFFTKPRKNSATHARTFTSAKHA